MIVDNLSFSYKDRQILKDLNFEVNDSEILMVLGVNGVGKSTLMKCLAGVNKFKGLVKFDKAKKLGYLTQNIIENDALSVFELVLLGRIGELKFRVSKDDLERVEHVLEHVGITHLSKRYFTQLSGGQQRLVLIAQMLARSPQILLLDEPTANLDLLHQRNILKLIKEYTKYYNTTTIINIHDINHALSFGDNILLLKDGEIAFFGKKQELDIELLSEVFGVKFEYVTSKSGEKIIIDI
ncbi:iron ABC transporter, ATP-binding protein [Campylobacter blaseri]|uniref:Iron ABC transporter ATP-binding protein n=1 Tax=Campylobacter blaseri TaxID=2042961 RepID=A0A2P8R3H1_9BACT|nr:ABC transporter ATP-binding protein [Campylobacter blaseri]PSM53039.1 iron ABC transporter ATP-binding protein [Campylobacter blaseri]PSM54506.1 iron ABC transporter ATP-binding protein [Campylobacter blaseri]QKF85246.1 iron ABC transporter, ATP-binding protein [Campylobacter blaseri]